MRHSALRAVFARAQHDGVLAVHINVRVVHSYGVCGDLVYIGLICADHVGVDGVVGFGVNIDTLVNGMHIEAVACADQRGGNGVGRLIRSASPFDQVIVQLFAVLENLDCQQPAGRDFAEVGGNGEVAVPDDIVGCLQTVVRGSPSAVGINRLVDQLAAVGSAEGDKVDDVPV